MTSGSLPPAGRSTTRKSLQRVLFSDSVGADLPLTVLRNGAMVDVIALPAELVDP